MYSVTNATQKLKMQCMSQTSIKNKCSTCATVKKDKLPCATCLCNPKIVATASKEKNRHKKQQYVYDKNARNHKSLKFKPGDNVRMHNNGQGKRAVVMEKAQSP